MELAELDGHAFSCLEGCGFCCTFQPEVSGRELALLRARVAPRPVATTFGDDRTFLQLQNKCGACTLLERRGCQQYDLRPAHCRYFPFHLYFGARQEGYVNYTCRGVERGVASHLRDAFDKNVLENASQKDVAQHEQLAREAHATFRRRARKAGKWGDARVAIEAALALGPRLLTRAGVEETCRRGGDDATAEDAAEDALGPFEEADVTRRPFYLAPDLRWLTFTRPFPDELEVLEMDERGTLTPTATLGGIEGWRDVSPTVAEGLHAYVTRIARRDLLVGSVYALVDDSGYETSVEEAAWLRMAEIAADLVVRARVLLALGVPEAQVADETARFYDSTFLDCPTIGGWL